MRLAKLANLCCCWPAGGSCGLRSWRKNIPTSSPTRCANNCATGPGRIRLAERPARYDPVFGASFTPCGGQGLCQGREEGAQRENSRPKTPVEKPAEEKTVARRDPFDTLLTKARPGNAPPENLPPGKAGLIVDTLRIDGIVHGPNGMIAIVSNSQQRVYFLREGDKLYDGSVEKITSTGFPSTRLAKTHLENRWNAW
jgi:hypothetical protein